MNALPAHAPPGTGDTPRHITVVRPGALGDTLLTLPALAALRHWSPDARITFIARADTLPLARANGLADEVWSWELPDWGVLFSAQSAPLTERAHAALVGADVVIVWAPDPDGALVRRLRSLGVARAIVAPAQPVASAGFSDAHVHAAVRLTDSLRPLGIQPHTRETLTALASPLRADAPDVERADALWNELRLPERVIALHPGSGSQRKRWPADRFAEVARLADAAGYRTLLLAGEADTQALAETQEALARRGVRVALGWRLSVPTLAALLALCVGYVGCDSGVSHLAGLVGAPTVAVFGPSDPARWAPLGSRSRAIRSPDGLLESLSAHAVWAELHALIAGQCGQ